MSKQYPKYDIPRRSIKDRIRSKRWNALVIEGLFVVVAVMMTIGILSPAPAVVKDTQDTTPQEIVVVENTTGVLSTAEIRSMAWDNLYNEDYHAAVAMYDVLIAEGEADANTYAGRGFAYGYLGEHALAVQDLTTSLEMNPNNLAALNNRCWSYSELGKLERAFNDCNALVNQDPNADYPYLNRGIINEQMGNMDNALADYSEWINRRGQQTMTHRNLDAVGTIDVPMSDGMVYFFPFDASTGQHITVTATSTQRDVDADPLLVIFDSNGQPLTANDDHGDWWDSYINFTAPSNGEYTIVMTHAGGSTDGQVQVALDVSDNVALGSDVAAYKADGYYALMSGDYEQALEAFGQALAINSHDAEALNWVGVTYRYMGDYTTSLDHINIAMRLDEDYTLPYLSRGLTYELMGNESASATDFYTYAIRNGSRNFYHTELFSSSEFELPMRDGWVYNIPFNATSGQVANIDVTTIAPGFVDPLIVILGPDNQPLAGNDDTHRSDFDAAIHGLHLPDDGQYTLVISHAEGGSNGTISVDLNLHNAETSFGRGCAERHGLHGR